MPTKNLEMNDEIIRIAAGEQPVTVSFRKGVGEFFIEEQATAPTGGGAWLGLQPESMQLDADQHLFVRSDGRALLVIIARTPLI